MFIRLATVSTILITAAAICAHATSQVKSLLDKSRQIGRMAGAPDPKYWWLSADRIIYFEHVPRPVSEEVRKQMGQVPPDFAPGYFKAFVFDVNAKNRRSFNVFNAAVAEGISAQPMLMSFNGGPPSETVYNLPSCEVSPDRKWFVWLSREESQWHSVGFDGKKPLAWPFSVMQAYSVWLPNDSWVELRSDYRNNAWTYTEAIVHSLTGIPDRKVAVGLP